jgi:acetylornithine deacetylase/succinyl-diaminopimelate desuccinylase-like protein
MSLPASVANYLSAKADQAVAELFELLRFPSVSADPAFRTGLLSAADWVAARFKTMGLSTRIVPTDGHPIVWAESVHRPGLVTVLVYGHYDVQPPDPLALWTTPPFEPTVRNGAVYARGATDDKGQFFTHIKAVEAWLSTVGELPVNIKFIIEGEEEVGSQHLERFLTDHAAELACDVAVVSDTSQYAPGIPAITYGLRGIIACEVTVTGPSRDLHSGIFGGAVANPANGLARLLAQLHDDQGRVQIPGFYDAVAPLSQQERAQFAALPFQESHFLAATGAVAVAGEAGWSTLERRWARPTCDVNGMLSGYTGVGPKTIIPSTAMAKITCRLVPHQDPDVIVKSLERFVLERCPPGLTLKFHAEHGCPAFVFEPTSPYLSAARAAIEQGFGAAPVLIREGGSIPVVNTFRRVLGVDTLLLGWGQNTDNLHSPDEHFSLSDFHAGIRSSAALWGELAALPRT